MRNWSTDEEALKTDPEAYTIWKLEQLINFGLEEGEKISEQELRQYWDKIDVDSHRRMFLRLLLEA